MFLSLPLYLVKLLSSIPVKIYFNANTAKLEILKDNRKKAGIYLWTHKESGNKYVGSAFDLSKRLKDYYSSLYLNQTNNYICKALKYHTHLAFSLSILEYINISNLSKEEARKLILSREQYHLDLIKPKYNILKIAGSSLGYKHTEESFIKFSGENHPLFGKTHSPNTIIKLSGKNNHMFGRKGNLHPMYGKSPSIKTRILSRIVQGTTIFVYDTQGSLVNKFNSAREAGLFFNCSHTTITRYVKNSKLFQGEWILSTSSTGPNNNFLKDN
jgi:group I intron endonuclease